MSGRGRGGGGGGGRGRGRGARAGPVSRTIDVLSTIRADARNTRDAPGAVKPLSSILVRRRVGVRRRLPHRPPSRAHHVTHNLWFQHTRLPQLNAVLRWSFRSTCRVERPPEGGGRRGGGGGSGRLTGLLTVPCAVPPRPSFEGPVPACRSPTMVSSGALHAASLQPDGCARPTPLPQLSPARVLARRVRGSTGRWWETGELLQGDVVCDPLIADHSTPPPLPAGGRITSSRPPQLRPLQRRAWACRRRRCRCH
jgi:hypothetical protein